MGILSRVKSRRTASLAASSIEYLVPRVLQASGEEPGSTWTLALVRLPVCRHGGNYWYRFNACAVSVSQGPEPSRRQDVPQPVYTESGNFIVPVDHPHTLPRPPLCVLTPPSAAEANGYDTPSHELWAQHGVVVSHTKPDTAHAIEITAMRAISLLRALSANQLKIESLWEHN